MDYFRLTLVFGACLTACGGQAPVAEQPIAAREAAPPRAPAAAPEKAAASTPEAAPVAAAPNLTRDVPTTCSGEDGCYPDEAFAERVCRGRFPDLPFTMFAKGAPWQKLYVKAVSVEPVNMYGGTRSRDMQFGEEVIVLRKRGPGKSSAAQISGPTDLDVLRWDGTCATVREEMFVTYIPGEMLSPRIVWKYLDDPIQEGLKANVAVERAQVNERKQCRESTPSDPTPACDKAMKKLTDAIVIAVRLGLALPRGSTPEWEKSQPTALR